MTNGLDPRKGAPSDINDVRVESTAEADYLTKDS
jgi:hypothetical protein